jgi:hypothetical protein
MAKEIGLLSNGSSEARSYCFLDQRPIILIQYKVSGPATLARFIAARRSRWGGWLLLQPASQCAIVQLS